MFDFPLSKNAIYWTFQGEGHLRGFQMCFLRLAGCSVNCPMCDTDYRVHERVGITEIVRRCDHATPANARDRWVWITGGEPADYSEHIGPLLKELRAARFSIAVATSGHKRFIPPVDWLSVSPHRPQDWKQTYGNEVKIVPRLFGYGIRDFQLAHPDEQTDFMYRYVQPMWSVHGEDEESKRECIEFLKENPNWALSRQDHKFWDVP